MVNITVACSSDDAIYPELLAILARSPKAAPALPAEAMQQQASSHTARIAPVAHGIGTPEEMEVRVLMDRLGGTAKKFLREAAEFCANGGRLDFTIPDLADRFTISEKGLRAVNRNIGRSAKATGVELWAREWDYQVRRMRFTFKSNAYIQAIRLYLH